MHQEIDNNNNRSYDVIWGFQEQGYHNYVIYSGKLSDISIRVYRNAAHRVANMASIFSDITFTNNNTCSIANVVPPILHQYDRHPTVVSYFNTLYSRNSS